METKTIIVLANSIKHKPNRCIAGVDYLGSGHWIRPVGLVGEGELDSAITLLDDGTQPSLLDIIEIQLADKAECLLQPENWYVQNGASWKRHADGKCSKDVLLSIVETPDNLWLQPGYKTDRVSHNYLNGHPPYHSLNLIKISKAKLNKEGKSARLYFVYHGANYALKVTDPNVHAILNGSSSIDIEEAIICVSLCPSWHNDFAGEDQHFKVVASIILL
jgi:hypothetical protein